MSLGYITIENYLYIYNSAPIKVPAILPTDLQMGKLLIYESAKEYRGSLVDYYLGLQINVSKYKRISNTSRIESIYKSELLKIHPIFSKTLPRLESLQDLGNWSSGYSKFIYDTLQYKWIHSNLLSGNEVVDELRLAYALLNYKIML